MDPPAKASTERIASEDFEIGGVKVLKGHEV
jgi:cytochrome P450